MMKLGMRGRDEVGFGFRMVRTCVAEGPWRAVVHALIGEMDMELRYG